jgi:hypothetical protein
MKVVMVEKGDAFDHTGHNRAVKLANVSSSRVTLHRVSPNWASSAGFLAVFIAFSSADARHFRGCFRRKTLSWLPLRLNVG